MRAGRLLIPAIVGTVICACIAAVPAAGAAPGTGPSPSLQTRVARVLHQGVRRFAPGPGGAPAGVHALAASPSVSVSDATGEVPDARGDLVSASAGADAHSSVFTARVATPSDPLTDDNWLGDTGPLWVIDSNYNRVIDYIAAMFRTDDDQLVGILLDGNIGVVCVGTGSYDGVRYTARFGSGCPRLRSFQWSAEMDYDLTPNGPDGDESADVAPETTPAAPTPLHRTGYWMMAGNGKLYEFGNAPHFVSNVPSAVAMTCRRDGTGVWVVDLLGGVHAFGTAKYKGGSPHLNSGEAVTTISATPSSKGYWLFTNLGRAIPFGDAKFLGDMRNHVLNGPVIDSVATSDGKGYYMVALDGGIFAFGNARFRGSMGGHHLNKPVVGIAPTPDGKGYWLVAEDGGVFAFHAPFRGSMGGHHLNRPVNGMVAFGNGYLMVASDGGVFVFSNKAFLGSLGGRALSSPIRRIAAFTT